MARPRIVTLGEGTVSLNGFSKEKAEQIEAMLNKLDTPEVSGLEGIVAVESSEMIDKAVGLRYNQKTKQNEIVTVSYNAVSKQAVVDSVVHVGEGKIMGINAFKVKVIELGFI